jgi:flavin reductase (DIM6/NTAB) family NADH-FMN oxidoreductase RutF
LSVSKEAFKQAMASWASGVTVVTSRAGDRLHGMTVSDFGGVSIDPPLVLVCANKDSITLEMVDAEKCFAVNVLAAGQDSLSNHFASKATEDARFDGIDSIEGKTGAPLLPEALASFDCNLVATHDAGDHVILVGQVEEVSVREGDPLLHYRGGYRALAAKDSE